MSDIGFSEKAWREYVDIQMTDKIMLRRINKLIKDIIRNPYKGIGHPEILKNDLSGNISRHIDDKNRIVYRVINKDDEVKDIEIISCKNHYNDK